MSNQFNNQRCSKCYQTYSGLKATCSASSCNHEHFFKKNEQLLCIMCLMEERNIKCGRCNKSITRLEEMGKWRGNSVLVDDHTYDIDTFCCECRECSDSENRKSKLKRCQGTFSVHYKCKRFNATSTQHNQCDSTVPIDGEDFCQHCKGQTETYQQLRARINKEQERGLAEFCQAMDKAQKYWDSLSSSEREKECERLVENIKLGKYWGQERRMNSNVEGYCSGWAHNWRCWEIKNGKFTSTTPHLAPVELGEEFSKKEFGDKELVLRDLQVVKKDNKSDKDNSPSPNFQPITNSDSKGDNSVDPVNVPPSNSEPRKNSSEIKISLNQVAGEPSRNEPKNNLGEKSQNGANEVSANNQVLVINLKDIKKISLVGDDLVIEFSQSEKTQTVVSEQIVNSQELSAVKDHLRNTHCSSVSQQELAQIISADNPNSNAQTQPSKSPFLWVASVGVIGVMAGVCWGLIVKAKKSHLKKK